MNSMKKSVYILRFLVACLLSTIIVPIDASGGKKKENNNNKQKNSAQKKNNKTAPGQQSLTIEDLVKDQLNPTEQELIVLNKVASLLFMQSEILAVLQECKENSSHVLRYQDFLMSRKSSFFADFFMDIKDNNIRAKMLQLIPIYNGFSQMNHKQATDLKIVLEKVKKNSDTFNFVQGTLARGYFDNSRKLLFKLSILISKYRALYTSLDLVSVEKNGKYSFCMPIIERLENDLFEGNTIGDASIDLLSKTSSALKGSKVLELFNVVQLKNDLAAQANLYAEIMAVLFKQDVKYSCIDPLIHLENVNDLALFLTVACRHGVQLGSYGKIIAERIQINMDTSENIRLIESINMTDHQKMERFVRLEEDLITNKLSNQSWALDFITNAIRKIVGDDGYRSANEINKTIKKYASVEDFDSKPVLGLLRHLKKSSNDLLNTVQLPRTIIKEVKFFNNNKIELEAAYKLLGIKDDQKPKNKNKNKSVSNKEDEKTKQQKNKDTNEVDTIKEGKQEILIEDTQSDDQECQEDDGVLPVTVSLKEKKNRSKNKSEKISISPEIEYAPRVLKYFEDEKFCSEKEYNDLFYHRFSKDVDTYLFKNGITYERPNKTIGTKDIVYEMAGEVVFDDGHKEMVVFHATKNKDGICYHRGYDIKPDLFAEYFQNSYWKVAQNEDNFPKLGIKKPEKNKSINKDGVIKEDDVSVTIRDNYLGATYTLYKPYLA